MDDVCSVIVIDDNALVAHSCQHMFNEAGLPWTVTRFGRLRDVVWPEGRTLAILDLHLDDGSRPAEIIGELTRRSIPVVVYTSCDDPPRSARPSPPGPRRSSAGAPRTRTSSTPSEPPWRAVPAPATTGRAPRRGKRAPPPMASATRRSGSSPCTPAG